MTAPFIDSIQLENERCWLRMSDTMALAKFHACSKRAPASRGKGASWSVSSVILGLCCSVKPYVWRGKWTRRKWEPFLKPLLTVLQRENTRLTKEVDKLEAKLWQAMDRADLDSQEVGRAMKETGQAKRLAAAADNRCKEVQGRLDELQPQLQVSLLSLQGVLQQPSGQHRGSWAGGGAKAADQSPSCLALQSPPLRLCQGHPCAAPIVTVLWRPA